MAVDLSFLDRSRYFTLELLLIYPHKAEWTSFQTHYYTENLVVPGIEPGTPKSAASKLPTRPQRRSTPEY
jgi:hypothetical protein